MKTAPKYLSMLGLALALAPSLHLRAEDTTKNPANSLDASFAAISETIKTARKQASEAVGERDKALAELAASEKQQRQTAKKLQEALRQQADTAKQLANTRKDLTESKTAQEKYKKQAEGLAKQLEIGNEAYAKLVKLRAQMQESLKNLAGIDESIATYRAELASPTSAVKLKGEIAELKESGKTLSKQLADSKTALETERQQRLQISKKASETERQLVAAQKQTAAIQKNRKKMDSRISELEKSQAQTATALKNAKKELAEARSNAEKTATEKKKSEEENAAASAENKARIADLIKAQKKAEQTAKIASAELASALENGKVLKNALQSSERKVGELESRMKELSKNSSKSDQNKVEGDS